MNRLAWIAIAAAPLAGVTACEREEPRILSVAQLADTRDVVGPYTVQAIVRGLIDGDVVEVRWSVDGEDGPYAPSRAETRDTRDDLLYGSIPAQVPGTRVHYYVVVVRDGLVVDVDPPGAARLADDFVDAGSPPSTQDAGTSPDAAAPKPHRDDAGPVPPLPNDGGAEPPPSDQASYSFRVLSPSEACVVDTDCRIGSQICVDGTCRFYGGVCVDAGNGTFACPDGYVCDTDHDPLLCVIAPRPCSNDDQCPTVEECDRDRGECMARLPCATQIDCPSGYECHPALGLCFKP